MFRHHDHTEAKCIWNNECHRLKHDTIAHHPDQYVTCCTSDNCTSAVMHQYQSGAGIHLRCKQCHDLKTNDCQGDQVCQIGEVCMVNAIDQRVESRCTKQADCHAQHDHHSHKLTVCCDSLDCAQKAIGAVKHVNVVPSTTVSSSTCSDNEDAHFKCSDYIRDFDVCNQITKTSKMIANTRCQKSCGLCPGQVSSVSVCSDHEDGNFSCADYIRDFNICQQVNGTGYSLATTKCQKSCGLCPGNGLVQTTVPVGTPPSGPTASVAPAIAQTTTQSPTTTQAPTKFQTHTQAPTNSQTTIQTSTNIAATTAVVTHPPCVDHDVQNSCTAYSFYFCAATSGQARDFAVSNCAKTCNLCYEYFASLTNSTLGSN